MTSSSGAFGDARPSTPVTLCVRSTMSSCSTSTARSTEARMPFPVPARRSTAGDRLVLCHEQREPSPGEVARHLRDLGFPRGRRVGGDEFAVRRPSAGGTGAVGITCPGGRYRRSRRGGRPGRDRTRCGPPTQTPVAVVQGHSPETGWPMLAEATLAIRAGALWVADEHRHDAAHRTGSGARKRVDGRRGASRHRRRARRGRQACGSVCSRMRSGVVPHNGRWSSVIGSTPTSRARTRSARTRCWS